jgi:protein TonB
MFDQVATRQNRRSTLRKGTFVGLSVVLEALAVLGVSRLSGTLGRAPAADEPVVEVKFIKAPPPSPPAPVATRAAPPAPPPRRISPARPRAPAPPRSRPLAAMIQPKELPPEAKVPATDEPPETSQLEQAPPEGAVIGGVVGGTQAGGNPVDEIPAYATAGYRRPELAVRNCLLDSLHLSKDVQREVSGAVTVKFAIRRDGVPDRFQLVSPVEDRRIGEAIWQAVSSCKWIPGADPGGHPVSIWVVVPFRFRAG